MGHILESDHTLRITTLPDAIDCPENRTLELAQTPTRLAALDPVYRERLINWGYAICDTAIRAHVDPKIPKRCSALSGIRDLGTPWKTRP